ncbi:hypothetical protein [Bowmanella denitrificans]|uniref:hypothetical protein n=1 Tax=Bowmanella denitrificans TaxID=366582 RepID=UPI000C9A9DEB|nr:hypothetical protein [Bowmanella denitrificans]
MTDILKRAASANTQYSRQLQEAQELLRSNLPLPEKEQRLAELRAQAPASDKAYFADLYSTLARQQIEAQQ